MAQETQWEAQRPTGHAAKFVAIRNRRTRQLVCIVEGPDAEANARLIVSAPEILQAVKKSAHGFRVAAELREDMGGPKDEEAKELRDHETDLLALIRTAEGRD